MEYDEAAPVLEAIGMAEASDVSLDLAAIAGDLGLSLSALRERLDWLDELGLALTGLEEGLPPRLLNAGRQYLTLSGRFDRDAMGFLPHTIDDLHARAALLHAGSVLVDEFRHAVITGQLIEHARELVPPAFAPAIDERTAISLFAAAVALVVRLSDGEPAGCVAEEIIAVELMNEAEVWLDMEVERGALDRGAARSAREEFTGLFELFQDDDVLDLFDMQEPSDAALAGHSVMHHQMGVVDQRVEGWFKPFGWTAPTGYLDDRDRPAPSD